MICMGVDELLSSSWSAKDKCLDPLYDVENRENEIIITVDLPCVSKDEVAVNVAEDSVEVGAEMERALKFERWGVIQREVEFRGFRKVIPLPEKVDPSAVKASFRKGVLTVVLPKAKKKFKIEVT